MKNLFVNNFLNTLEVLVFVFHVSERVLCCVQARRHSSTATTCWRFRANSHTASRCTWTRYPSGWSPASLLSPLRCPTPRGAQSAVSDVTSTTATSTCAVRCRRGSSSCSGTIRSTSSCCSRWVNERRKYWRSGAAGQVVVMCVAAWCVLTTKVGR